MLTLPLLPQMHLLLTLLLLLLLLLQMPLLLCCCCCAPCLHPASTLCVSW
jgi:hypothetical protein